MRRFTLASTIFGPTLTSPTWLSRKWRTHTADAGLVHEIDNQLQLVQALEVRHLRLIPASTSTSNPPAPPLAPPQEQFARRTDRSRSLLEGRLNHAGTGTSTPLAQAKAIFLALREAF